MLSLSATSEAMFRKPRAPRAGSTAAHAHRRHDHLICSTSHAPSIRHGEAGCSLANSPASPPRALTRTHVRPSDVSDHSIQFWHELADQLVQQEQALQSLLHQQQTAVAQERFDDASQASAQLLQVQSQDILARLRADQAGAVAAEDFVQAAALQKARLASLLGWWQITPDKKDVRGHVLHVSETFGKLVGRVYTATDLAQIFGCTPENHLGVRPSPHLMSRLGTAIFEVIFYSISRSDDANFPSCAALSSIQHQPFFLPQSISALCSRTAASARSLQRPKPMSTEGLSSQPRAGTNSRSKPVHERSSIRRPKFPHRRRAHITAPFRPSSPSLVPTAGLESARASLERSLALESVPDVPQASGAALTTLDEDSVPKPEDLQCLDGLDAAAGLEQHLLGEAKEPQTDEDIMAMSLADARRKLFSGETAYTDLPAQPQGGALATVDLSHGDWTPAAAEELPAAAPRYSMATASPIRLEALLDVPTASSGPAASLKLSVPEAGTELQYSHMDTPQGASDCVHGADEQDPLTGYFLGSYGSNGSELLHLQRGVWQGRPAIIAHKVTGDEHVPAGQVSFRVHTDTAAVRPQYQVIMGSSSVLQGEGCSTVCRHSGETSWMDGELVVFGPGATQPFQELAGGAQLGFIWSGGFHRRFLILLTKLQFSALHCDA